MYLEVKFFRVISKNGSTKNTISIKSEAWALAQTENLLVYAAEVNNSWGIYETSIMREDDPIFMPDLIKRKVDYSNR
jgi:hypothetical protein